MSWEGGVVLVQGRGFALERSGREEIDCRRGGGGLCIYRV